MGEGEGECGLVWYGMRGDKGRISIEFYDKRLGLMLFWKWVRWRDGWQGETLSSC